MATTQQSWDDPDPTYRDLPMFVNPADIIDQVRQGNWTAADADGFGGDIFDLKLEEGQVGGLCDSIASDGVRMPIVVAFDTYKNRGDQPMQGNGHHRVACAASLGIELIPAVYTSGGIFAYSAKLRSASYDNWGYDNYDEDWTDDEPDDEPDESYNTDNPWSG